MLQEYKELKKKMEDEETLYENYSIHQEPLFGLEEFYSEKYLSGNYKVPITTILDCQQQLDLLNKKSSFIVSYLQNYKAGLEKKLQELDEEFIQMSENSLKGQFFLDMVKIPNFYNRVIDYDIIYRHNTSIVDSEVIKTNESLAPIPYRLKYVGNTSFFAYFKESNCQNIFLSFHNEVEINIFGVKTDGTMELIQNNIKILEDVIINTTKSNYVGLFIEGIDVVCSLLKNIKIFRYSKQSIRKNGYIVFRLKDLEKISAFTCSSYSDSELYLLTQKEYDAFLNHFQINEEEAVKSYLNNTTSFMKNTRIDNQNKSIIVEKLNKETFKTNLLKVFGVENEN